MAQKLIVLFFFIAVWTKLFTKRSVLILYEKPKTVANLNAIEFLCFKINVSASNFVLPYNEIGFRGEFSSQNLFFCPIPYPELVVG